MIHITYTRKGILTTGTADLSFILDLIVPSMKLLRIRSTERFIHSDGTVTLVYTSGHMNTTRKIEFRGPEASINSIQAAIIHYPQSGRKSRLKDNDDK